jgi:hypothetical protein
MNDPIAKPASDTVTWFGAEVPVFEHMLVGEIDELQKVLANDSTAFRKDLECFVILAKYRADAKLNVAKLLKEPIDWEAFTSDLRRLLAPFTRAQKALLRQHLRDIEAMSEIAGTEGERLLS